MGFIANVFINTEKTNIKDIPEKYIVQKSEVSSSTVSIEISQVNGVSQLEYSESLSITFEDGSSLKLSDARLMGAGNSSGY